MTDPAGADDDVAALVARLREHRAQRVAQVDALGRALAAMLAASEDSNADDEHDPEGSTIAFERAQLTAQLEHARSGVAEVDAALTRLRDGGYGRCTACGAPIDAARLEARPTAQTCLTCASSRR